MNLTKLKNYNTRDTISAIATFPSKSALGVIKISGKSAINIISKIFLPAKKKDIKKAKTYTMHYGWIVERNQKPEYRNQNGKIVDEVLVSIMRGPHSYTCEDVVEISSHGGMTSLNKILEIILKNNSRQALPGEFTYRAFLGGRLDLLQAQSVLNIVDAKSEDALGVAVSQLKGGASLEINGIKEAIKELFVLTESLINFPEEGIDIDTSGIKQKLKTIRIKIQDILESNRDAKILKDGLRCVICGKTNAGKSTLFNCLLREERVIVSAVAGTTRDVIEETINVRGVPLRIYDTAGILEPRDLIEKKAIEKSSLILEEADLVILVLDGSKALSKDDVFLINRLKKYLNSAKKSSGDNGKDVVIVINKSDLKQKIGLTAIKDIKCCKVNLSARTGQGIRNLEEAIFKTAYKNGTRRKDLIFLNTYQNEALKKAFNSIIEAESFLNSGRQIDSVNFSLKESLEAIGRLTGEVLCEELLESIFSQFCIGK
ncbi:MAG: tRNA uridine-5-carboxymethylaminomethyl(34) synthesis GTPase MnmE [Candidatus Omnitrophota bacterium]|jgi:tRNA modification GTPase